MWPFTKKAPPQNVREQAIQSPRSRFNPMRANVYEAKKQPTPGTRNYAYENLGLVEFSPIGDAVANRLMIHPTQPGQFYQRFGTYYQGIGGLAQGQIFGQPLINPSIPIDEQFGSG